MQTSSLRNKKFRENQKKNHPVRYTCSQLYNSALKRAKARGFDIDIDYKYLMLISPQVCPVFNVPLRYGAGFKGKFAASLDRIDSSKGYTKDNVQVISRLANLMKSNATPAEMRLFSIWSIKD